MVLLMLAGASVLLPRPGNSASLARKASTSALVIVEWGLSPNAGSRCASKIASTLNRCRRRHCGAISERQVIENSEKVGVGGAGGVAVALAITCTVVETPAAAPLPGAGEENCAAFWLLGKVAA